MVEGEKLKIDLGRECVWALKCSSLPLKSTTVHGLNDIVWLAIELNRLHRVDRTPWNVVRCHIVCVCVCVCVLRHTCTCICMNGLWFCSAAVRSTDVNLVDCSPSAPTLMDNDNDVDWYPDGCFKRIYGLIGLIDWNWSTSIITPDYTCSQLDSFSGMNETETLPVRFCPL